MKAIKKIRNSISFCWQLPQNLIGLILVKSTKASRSSILAKGKWYTFYIANYCKGSWGVSLGNYVVFGTIPDIVNNYHEIGHQKQSKILGWLYLLLIGLPSLIGNILHRFIDFDYYKQPWESWADKLGGVKRQE